MNKLHRDSRKQVFEEKAGFLLKIIETFDNFRKEVIEKQQRKSFTEKEVKAIYELKDAVTEAERYNRNSNETVDLKKLKQKIVDDSEMVREVEELKILQQSLLKSQENALKNSNSLSQEEKGQFIRLSDKLNEQIALENSMENYKLNRGSFDESDQNDNNIE